jgi:hypothetical protein
MPSFKGGDGSRVGGGDKGKDVSGYWTDFTSHFKDIVVVVTDERDRVVNGDTGDLIFTLDEGRTFDEFGEGE